MNGYNFSAEKSCTDPQRSVLDAALGIPVFAEADRQLIAHAESDRVQTLIEHSLSVSSLTSTFMKKLNMGQIGALAGLLHDLGKSSEKFQRYIRSASGLISKNDSAYLDPVSNKGKIDHSSAGAKICMNTPRDGKFEMLSCELIAIAVMSHHTGLPDIWRPGCESSFDKRVSPGTNGTGTSLSDKSYSEIREYVADSIHSECATELESAVMNISDTESGEAFYFRLGLLVRFVLSCLVDADRIDTASFMSNISIAKPEVPNWKKMSENLSLHLSRFDNCGKINEMRNKVSECCAEKASCPKGAYVLSVPTGGGKTLSSLRFAIEHASYHNLDRIVYVAPFISIIDQNAKAIREALGSEFDKLIVEHHSSVTRDSDFNDDVRVTEDNWDSPIILTTMVQYLNTFFSSGTSSARRMHNLANSVIIFDEIQSTPTRCIHPYNLSVNFLTQDCGSTAVLCTATQPEFDKMTRPIIMANIPEIVSPDVYRNLPIRTRIVDKRLKNGWEYSNIANLAIEQHRNGKSVLVILNTKRCAETTSKLIQREFPNVKYLSTNLCPFHRLEVITHISKSLSSKEPVICVSTQVIEAGVDLDFDTVIRALAGLDSIVQAAGRCNRGGRQRTPGEVLIINPSGENIGPLTEIRVGKHVTGRLFDDVSPDSPSILSEYRKRYNKELTKTKSNVFDYPLDKYESSLVKMLSDNLCEYRSTHGTERILTQSFRAANTSFKAIDDNSIGIIILNAGGKIHAEAIKKIAEKTKMYPHSAIRSAQKYMVNVRGPILEKMVTVGVAEQIPGTEIWVYSGRYDEVYGLMEEWR
jgi:CRISPR-associated endonuclease/helicase Cas3